ncbi:translocation/assembly module TamB domain-containing protein [Pedobacter sp. SYP-B3415]|uniref:translocation/assembly module TamB domain-containing protein n=1 Tax=Pedobacter sp. SYP-B3415 TaxID=2496641 RepID=UPI00101B6236|nr:translocation/assembly module TamB domain-containing protein [Pedobacter sp. SYP-B3415]
MNKYIRKTLKVLLWIVAIIIVLVVGIAASLNIPAVQNFVKDKAITWLKKKTNTQVSLESIKIALPKDVVLNKFYIEDRNKDTLLYAGKLQVDISLLKLLKNQVEVNDIQLRNVRANVKRIAPDTSFNFSFLVDAFASDQKKPEEETVKDSTSTLKFSVSKVEFEDIGINYRDDVAGNDVRVYLGAFTTRIKDFDLANQRYVISRFSLDNTNLSYMQQKPLVQLANHLENSVDTAKASSGKLPYIEVEDFSFKQVKVAFNDRISNMNADLKVGELGLKGLSVNLTDSKFGVNDALLNNSDIRFAFKPAEVKKVDKALEETKPAADNTQGLALVVQKINLKNNTVRFDNLAAKPAKRGLDFNHLLISGLNLGAEQISYGAAGIRAKVNNASLKDKSGFVLEELKGNAVYTDQMISLQNFVLRTPNTTINNSTDLRFSSLDDLTKHPERVKIDLKLTNTVIGVKDAGYFSDAVPAAYRNETLRINARVDGYMNNLNIPQLQVNGLKNTVIDVSGTAKGLPDVNKAFLDLNIKRFSLTKQDLLVVIPRKSLPSNMTLPNTVNLNGTFRGGVTNFNTALQLRSDMGNARILAKMSGPKGREQYDATVALNNFNVGRLLKQQPKLGRVTVRAKVAGTGIDPKTLNARFTADLVNAYYNNYTYRNLRLQGTYARQRVTVKGSMPDSNANFRLDAAASLAGKYPAVKLDLDLRRLDLQKLNFSKTELSAAGLIKADFATADADYLNGSLDLTGLQLAKDGRRFNVDTISVRAASSAAENSLTLRSEILDATIDGKYQLTKVGSAVINEINKYYQFGTVANIPDQRLRFFMRIKNPKIIQDFVPELTTFKPAVFYGLVDTQKDSLKINADFPGIVYGDFAIDSTRLVVDNKDQRLDYRLFVKSLKNPSIQLFNTELTGNAANNKLLVNIFLRDSGAKDKYVLGGTFESINKDYRFSMDPNKLVLAYEKWAVSPDNFIQFGKSGILVNQFQLSNNNQLLGINSTGTTPNSPLEVTFKDFQIETITRLAETDTTLVGGKINGNAIAKDLTGSPKFEANLTIDQLRYQKDQLGTLRVAVNNNTENAFETNIALSGVHELRANGFYYTAPQSSIDLTLNIDKIDLKEIESLSGGQIRQGTGNLTGQLAVKGSLTAPRVNGDLTFRNAGFNVAMINSFFRLPNERILFDDQGIAFDNFTLIDSLNQKAVIDGRVYTQTFRDFRFGLDIKTDNFRVLNSTVADNELFYGTVFLSSNIKVRGDLNQPDVDADISINDKTKFYFAIPSNDPAVIEQDGIVQFIDEDAAPFNGKPALNVDSLTKSPISGISFSANIDIDKDAEFNVVVDPANGDALRVKGQAELNATMDPSGKISLTGTYELNDGGYNLSVGPLKREFKIQNGSTITWTGEPTSANLDMTAIYEVEAAPIDLVADQIENRSTLEQNRFKQKFPFRVLLNLDGELMKPDISFALEMPEGQGGPVRAETETKIQQVNANPNELNKQVFALLALGRFIADNPFQSLAGGGGVSTLARQSVSKLLTEQLNNLASDLIKGVDLNFGVNSTEDYSTGQLENKTDLEVGLSKRLLNDRLTVSVGSSFGLEGPRPDNQKTSNIAGNVNIEYLLSNDGRYRLRAYRRNEYEGIIEGQIIETGVGFALVVDYNRFREIFQRSREKKNKEQRPRDDKKD